MVVIPKSLNHRWMRSKGYLLYQTKSPQVVATTTSKGALHKYIVDLRSEDLTWIQIKRKLFERFSECGSSTMAKHKLVQFKQSNLPMHSFISKFTDMTEQAYSMQPDDPRTQILVTTSIEAVDNIYIKNKLSNYPLGTLKDMSDHAINEEHRQKIRATDFGAQSKPTSILNTEINAIDSK